MRSCIDWCSSQQVTIQGGQDPVVSSLEPDVQMRSSQQFIVQGGQDPVVHAQIGALVSSLQYARMYACVQVNVCMRADEFSGRSFSYFPLACCTKIHQIIKPRFRVTNSSWTKFQIVVRDIRNHVFSVWRILDWGCSVLMETVINRMILLSWASYDEKGPIQRGLLCKRKQITQYQIT